MSPLSEPICFFSFATGSFHSLLLKSRFKICMYRSWTLLFSNAVFKLLWRKIGFKSKNRNADLAQHLVVARQAKQKRRKNAKTATTPDFVFSRNHRCFRFIVKRCVEIWCMCVCMTGNNIQYRNICKYGHCKWRHFAQQWALRRQSRRLF